MMRHKKWLALLLAVCMLMSAVPVMAEDAQAPAAEIPQEEAVPALASLEPQSDGVNVAGKLGTWQSATVLNKGQVGTATLSTFDGSFTNNQYWFAVDTDRDQQAIELSFTGVKKSMVVYVYDKAVLKTDGPLNNNFIKNWSFSSDTTVSVKTGLQGTYYIMVRPYNNNYLADAAIYMAWDLLDGDANELAGGNDTYENATELTAYVNTYFNLNGQNDTDWFRFTANGEGEAVKLIFNNFDYTVPKLKFRLLAEDQTELEGWRTFDENYTFNYKFNEPGTYYVQVQPYDKEDYTSKLLKLRFETVIPDGYEINDSYDKATLLPDAYDLAFNLNAFNDEDWFQFATSEENEVIHLYFSGFDLDYANKIRYWIYDAETGGYNTSPVKTDTAQITYHSTIMLATPGVHYLRVMVNTGNSQSMPVENTLKVRIERGVSDDGEPNETFEQAVPLSYETPVAFNLPDKTDIDWFSFTVDKDWQTVKFNVANIPSGSTVAGALFSEEALIAKGSSALSMCPATYSNSSRESKWMLETAGTYYVRLKYSSGNVFEGSPDTPTTISYTLIPADENENNNTYSSAVGLTEGTAMSFSIPATNDMDWFCFNSTKPNQTVELTFAKPKASGLTYTLYSGAAYELGGSGTPSMANGSWSTAEQTYRCMLSEIGAYYIRVKYNSGSCDEQPDAASVTYTLIDPDETERNNDRDTAYSLNRGIATAFTILSSDDKDWFSFETEELNQTAELTFNFADSCYLWYAIYSQAAYEANGDMVEAITSGYLSASANGGEQIVRCMLSERGTHYVQVRYSGGKYVDKPATVVYDLIAPDGNEGNGSAATATPLAVNTVGTFTLPARNDQDWFKLAPVEVGDKITVYFGTAEGVWNQRLHSIMHVMKEGSADVTAAGGRYPQNGSSIQSWTVDTAGQYYLKIDHDANWSDNLYSIRYTITRDAVTLQSISDIINGGSTLFQGKTLQLYAVTNPSNASDQEVTWTSSNPKIAAVDASTGLVTGVAPGQVTITATAKNNSEIYKTTTIIVAEPVAATGVTLRYPAVSKYQGTRADPQLLALDSFVQMEASVQPVNATERDLLWSVSDENVLSVTAEGRVYAVGSGGPASVTVADASNTYKQTFWFSVPDASYPVRGVSLDRSNATVYMGETLTLKASVYPGNALNQSVNWISQNEAVATVDEYGVITPVQTGYTTIIVKTVEGSYTAECAVSVQPQRVRVKAISFAETTLALGLYGEVRLQPVFDPINATDQTVTWSSSNETVATVSRSGLVTALGLGQTTITARSTDGEHTATVTIQVSLNADYGDLDNNGDVNVADAILVLQASVGNRTLSADQKKSADVNGDGRCNVADAILILRYSVGAIKEFPVESK